MKTIHNYHELALKLLSIMYRSEHQYITYLQVFEHKAKSKELKSLIFDLKQSTNYKLHFHLKVLRSLKSPLLYSKCEGITGIFKEAFSLMQEGEKEIVEDAIILNALMQASHYKLGNYLTLKIYLQLLNFDQETEILKKIVKTEESVLKKINTSIKEDFIMTQYDLHLEEIIR